MIEIPSATEWYLAQLRPNCAALAKRNLARQGFGSFLPLERYTKRSGKRLMPAKRPYFPGYLFVSVAAHSSPWRAILSTSGISQLVRFGDKPSPVPSSLVSELQRACDDDGCLSLHAEFKEGESVRIARGPFAGLVGRIDQLTPEKRVWVLLDVIGKSTRVSIRDENLRSTRESP